MKYFLLIAGYNYYPQGGTDDWIATFDTYKDAQKEVVEIPIHTYFTKGKNKGEVKSTYFQYQINDKKYDWYKIIDLMDWIR